MFKSKKKLNNQRLLVADLNSKSPVFESYRTLRTNIQFASVDQDIKKIVITSPKPGEGKSTTVANLAIAFAQQGKKVLLIDADLRKPTVANTFSLPNTSGLTNVLSRQSKIEQVIQQTAVENLHILTSGPIPPNPSELLGSNSMKELVAKAENEFDIILFDSPPVLAVTDAQVLTNLSDGTILVVRSGSTDQDAAKKAKDLLQVGKSRLLGVVLNGKNQKQEQYYYYY
ncbi:capsular biosynthesis protein [Fictibacillus arsenicus]|uniref:non-specific protein-tyrosine kinase n=1 Tax=Fictibacillus arsenicus TaxID=255247 RepID=A0A1B1Z952_9BACL|nr:CpsD/CapB family tyrosine-protein kinase [Fictibacillus arsenicus]ANX13967.1 capsular biosynthesis protein [Fictibacillus arsenicus]